ncbi:vitamin K epoxide reductase family protein [uncultured Bifidobacterium sp.]|uniref:vitamin K epoxide reductase family protein n=1 Tax=uncultured Bifidobacterium sp. TaxID=165187 RepID=UPI00261BF12F|nr:vitamin K epoxide reductase family protein [uncultured Bifidobacterium sp.]
MTTTTAESPTHDASDLLDSEDAEALENHASVLTGWRHGPTWTYLIMLLSSIAALIVSFVLSAETLQIARHPQELLGCDVNKVLSCSTVAESWQAELIHFGGLSYPNAFFGIAAESVFITIAVLGITRIAVPRWFAICTWLGGLAALAYSYWLFSQSMFVINALCPWCLGLMFATTIQFMVLSHATVTVQGIPMSSGLRSYYRLRYDLMVDVVWILALITLILVKDGAAIFA